MENFEIPADMELHRNRLEAELEHYYGHFDSFTEPLLVSLEQMLKESEHVSSYELKTRMYELLELLTALEK